MRTFLLAACAAIVVVLVAGAAFAAPKTAKAGNAAAVQRGEYLVTIGGCNDCHTPWKMGPNGPEQDRSRLLSGHPEALAISSAPQPQQGSPWMIGVAPTFTAWSGPWGVSFTANLTPDPETGLGTWTPQNFIEAMRTGRHQGRGRQILPPMPWQNYARMTDADLRAVFAYLQSIPAIKNRVPDPIQPAVAQGSPGAGGAGSSTGSAATPGASESGTGSGGAGPGMSPDKAAPPAGGAGQQQQAK